MVAEQKPCNSIPGPQDVSHDLQAVCPPATSWYWLGPQFTHDGEPPLALQVPDRNLPAEHEAVQLVQAVTMPLVG